MIDGVCQQSRPWGLGQRLHRPGRRQHGIRVGYSLSMILPKLGALRDRTSWLSITRCLCRHAGFAA